MFEIKYSIIIIKDYMRHRTDPLSWLMFGDLSRYCWRNRLSEIGSTKQLEHTPFRQLMQRPVEQQNEQLLNRKDSSYVLQSLHMEICFSDWSAGEKRRGYGAWKAKLMGPTR